MAFKNPEIVTASQAGFKAGLKAASLQFRVTQLKQQQRQLSKLRFFWKEHVYICDHLMPWQVAHLPTIALVC